MVSPEFPPDPSAAPQDDKVGTAHELFRIRVIPAKAGIHTSGSRCHAIPAVWYNNH